MIVLVSAQWGQWANNLTICAKVREDWIRIAEEWNETSDSMYPEAPQLAKATLDEIAGGMHV